jgi:hypothetical protein
MYVELRETLSLFTVEVITCAFSGVAVGISSEVEGNGNSRQQCKQIITMAKVHI